MQLTRNHYLIIGVLLLLVGLQFRLVDSYVLNEKATRILNRESAQPNTITAMFYAASSGGSRKIVKPPDWAGWCLISIGSVLILHSLAMRNPPG